MSPPRRLLVFSVVLLFSGILTAAAAQNSATEIGSDSYQRALNDLLSQGRAASLEIFLEDHPNSPLRKDALELLIWKYQQDHALDKEAWAARRLARFAPGNAAALAAMAETGEDASGRDSSRAQDLKLIRDTATRGLLALAQFTAPQGISAALFDEMRREFKATLDSALGMAALNSKDYLTAQIHLRDAVSATPENADRLDALARAYLLASPPDNPDGMWFLARVSNLASPQLARQADAYGRKLSRSLYGSESRWQDLLNQTQFADFPEAAASAAASTQEASAPAPSLTNSNASERGHTAAVLKIKAALADANQVLHAVPRLEITVEGLGTQQGTYSRTVVTDASGTAQITLPAGRYGIVTPHGVTSGEQWYTWDLEVAATEPRNYVELTKQNATAIHLASRPETGATAPVSRLNSIFLGIVVDTSASMGSQLDAVKDSLQAAVSQLHPGEQVFVVEAGGRPRITQVLSADVNLLRTAIMRMAPDGRNALYDGVIAATNYLRSRAGQGSLALLIIANARDGASHATLKQATAALRSLHVNTYCIGTRDDQKLHDVLTELAGSAGDEALFPRLPSLTAVSQGVMAAVADQSSVAGGGAANGDDPPPAASPRPLHSYPAVTVKQFVVEDGPDTAGFPGGDEFLLQKLVVGRMRRYTKFQDVADGSESRDFVQGAPGDRLTLAGIVIGYNTGGRLRRDLVGTFGGVMTLTVRFVFRDAQTGSEVYRTELSSTGGPVFFGGSVEEMRSQAMLRLADALVKAVNRAK